MTHEIDHKTIGSGDAEPKTYSLKVLPHVYDEIIHGRRIVDALENRVRGIEPGDILRLREWTIVLDRPQCYRKVGGFTRRETLWTIVEVLPTRHRGYTTFIIRLVNEKSLYGKLRSLFVRAFRSLTFSRPR